MKAKLLTVIGVIAFTLAACDDNTVEMGTSITPQSDSLNVAVDTFTVSTNSVLADSVLARTATGYIGKVKDPETGSYISSDFMTQFGIIENYQFPAEDSIISKVNGKVVADSCDIRLFVKSFYGDSLNLMKLTAYELAKPVEEGTNYYTNYSIENNGYIRSKSNGGIEKDKSYTLVDLNVDYDTRYSSSYSRNIRIPLNSPYTDKNNVTYSNLGTYLMRKYYDEKNSGNYKNSYNFIHKVLPGFYFKTKSGLGNMVYVDVAKVNVYYRLLHNTFDTTDSVYKDSIYHVSTSFAGTEEVLQTNHISNDTKSINKLVADQSCTYLKTPAGIFTEMSIPVSSIYKNHENDTLNTAKVVLTRLNNNTQDQYSLSIPSTLLMIEKDSLYSFFEKEKIANYKNSFLSSYSSTYNTYTFNNFSGLVSDIWRKRNAGVVSDANWEQKHPNWNKVILVPVSTTYSTLSSSSVLTKVVHDMSLSSTRLVGGDTKLKMSVVYSKFISK